MAYISVDWLTIYQCHDPATTRRFGGEYVLSVDPETGMVQRERITGYQHKGSFESSLRIRADGGRVEVSGNPSRWDRPDNLFGVRSVDDAIAIFNRALRLLGLPEFTGHLADHTRSIVRERLARVGEFRQFLLVPAGVTRRGMLQGSDGSWDDGPRITRIDLCRNLSCGAGNIPLVMRWLEAQAVHGHNGTPYPDGGTVDWNRGSRRFYLKYYDKAKEIWRHLKREPKGPWRDHLEKLAGWCEELGIVRQEISLKATKLRDEGLQSPNSWRGEKMAEVIDLYGVHKNASGNYSNLERIAHILEERGYKSGLAQRAQQCVLAWTSGYRPKEQMPKSSYYQLRKVLLEEFEIDISGAFQVGSLAVTYNTVELRDVEPPVDYALPV